MSVTLREFGVPQIHDPLLLQGRAAQLERVVAAVAASEAKISGPRFNCLFL